MKKYFKKIMTVILTLAIVMTAVLPEASNTASAAVWRNVYSSKGMIKVAADKPFETTITLKSYSDIMWTTVIKSLFSYTITLCDSTGKAVETKHIKDYDTDWYMENLYSDMYYQRVDSFNGHKAGKYTIRVEFGSDVEVKFSAQTRDAEMPVLKDQEITAGFKTTLAVKDDTIKKCVSSNKKVAAVTAKGVVTGKKKGTAKVTVTTAKGKKLTCKITVKANVYTAEKITKKDVYIGAYTVKPYSAKYDAKGNLVVKAMAISKNPRKIKVKVWPDSFKNMADTKKMASVTLPANSAKSVTLKFSKSSLVKEKVNLPIKGLKLFIRQ